MKDYEKSYQYFIERMNHKNEGFIQEKIDAIFEAGRIANFQLNKPWTECEQLYLYAYELDKSRPDALYFLGIHYYLEKDNCKAYDYFKRAFDIGYPEHCQYSLKPTLSYHFLPKFLSQLCYEFKNYSMGEACTRQFLEKNDISSDMYNVILSWYNIFVYLNKSTSTSNIIQITNEEDKPILCFIADGGFSEWSGSDILTKGVGGSETYIIEMANYIQKQGHFKVVVFCKCSEQSVFEDVDYCPLSQLFSFIKHVYIHTCMYNILVCISKNKLEQKLMSLSLTKQQLKFYSLYIKLYYIRRKFPYKISRGVTRGVTSILEKCGDITESKRAALSPIIRCFCISMRLSLFSTFCNFKCS